MDSIYDELDNFEYITANDKGKEELNRLHAIIKEQEAEISRLKENNHNLNEMLDKIQTNFNSLLKTARAEVERKNEMINSLNMEKDQLIFRQIGNRNLGKGFNRQFRRDADNETHSEVSKATKRKITSPISERNKIPRLESNAANANTSDVYVIDDKSHETMSKDVENTNPSLVTIQVHDKNEKASSPFQNFAAKKEATSNVFKQTGDQCSRNIPLNTLFKITEDGDEASKNICSSFNDVEKPLSISYNIDNNKETSGESAPEETSGDSSPEQLRSVQKKKKGEMNEKSSGEISDEGLEKCNRSDWSEEFRNTDKAEHPGDKEDKKCRVYRKQDKHQNNKKDKVFTVKRKREEKRQNDNKNKEHGGVTKAEEFRNVRNNKHQKQNRMEKQCPMDRNNKLCKGDKKKEENQYDRRVGNGKDSRIEEECRSDKKDKEYRSDRKEEEYRGNINEEYRNNRKQEHIGSKKLEVRGRNDEQYQGRAEGDCRNYRKLRGDRTCFRKSSRESDENSEYSRFNTEDQNRYSRLKYSNEQKYRRGNTKSGFEYNKFKRNNRARSPPSSHYGQYPRGRSPSKHVQSFRSSFKRRTERLVSPPYGRRRSLEPRKSGYSQDRSRHDSYEEPQDKYSEDSDTVNRQGEFKKNDFSEEWKENTRKPITENITDSKITKQNKETANIQLHIKCQGVQEQNKAIFDEYIDSSKKPIHKQEISTNNMEIRLCQSPDNFESVTKCLPTVRIIKDKGSLSEFDDPRLYSIKYFNEDEITLIKQQVKKVNRLSEINFIIRRNPESMILKRPTFIESSQASEITKKCSPVELIRSLYMDVDAEFSDSSRESGELDDSMYFENKCEQMKILAEMKKSSSFIGENSQTVTHVPTTSRPQSPVDAVYGIIPAPEGYPSSIQATKTPEVYTSTVLPIETDLSTIYANEKTTKNKLRAYKIPKIIKTQYSIRNEKRSKTYSKENEENTKTDAIQQMDKLKKTQTTECSQPSILNSQKADPVLCAEKDKATKQKSLKCSKTSKPHVKPCNDSVLSSPYTPNKNLEIDDQSIKHEEKKTVSLNENKQSLESLHSCAVNTENSKLLNPKATSKAQNKSKEETMIEKMADLFGENSLITTEDLVGPAKVPKNTFELEFGDLKSLEDSQCFITSNVATIDQHKNEQTGQHILMQQNEEPVRFFESIVKHKKKTTEPLKQGNPGSEDLPEICGDKNKIKTKKNQNKLSNSNKESSLLQSKEDNFESDAKECQSDASKEVSGSLTKKCPKDNIFTLSLKGKQDKIKVKHIEKPKETSKQLDSKNETMFTEISKISQKQKHDCIVKNTDNIATVYGVPEPALSPVIETYVCSKDIPLSRQITNAETIDPDVCSHIADINLQQLMGSVSKEPNICYDIADDNKLVTIEPKSSNYVAGKDPLESLNTVPIESNPHSEDVSHKVPEQPSISKTIEPNVYNQPSNDNSTQVSNPDTIQPDVSRKVAGSIQGQTSNHEIYEPSLCSRVLLKGLCINNESDTPTDSDGEAANTRFVTSTPNPKVSPQRNVKIGFRVHSPIKETSLENPPQTPNEKSLPSNLRHPVAQPNDSAQSAVPVRQFIIGRRRRVILKPQINGS